MFSTAFICSPCVKRSRSPEFDITIVTQANLKYLMVMVAKRERWAKPDVKKLEADLQVTDEVVRSRAVGGLCPGHAGWDLFEDKLDVVIRSLRDPSRAVRRSALHAFEDAAVMQSREDLKYSLEEGEEKIGEKRALHFRPMELRLEARANRKIERRKRSNRISHRHYR